MGDLEQFAKDLNDDINKYALVYASSGAHEAMRLMCEYARVALVIFYGSYTPSFYRRTFNIESNSYIPYYKNNGKTCYGGIRLSASYIEEYKHAGISTEDIYHRVIYKGLHGETVTRSPVDIILQFGRSAACANAIQTFAFNEARRQNYKVLRI